MSGMGGFHWLLKILHDRLNPPADPKPTHLSNQTILITGSNTGVGFAAALKFVQLNAARVILAVRSVKKGEDAKAEIEKISGRKGVVEVWECDMGNYGSLRALAERIEREVENLGVVVLNAGLAMLRFEEGKYGWEGTLQVWTTYHILTYSCEGDADDESRSTPSPPPSSESYSFQNSAPAPLPPTPPSSN